MALDFSNRDPKDPRGVATIAPYASKAFLPSRENDWSDFTTDANAAYQRGLKREVDVALVTLNNGDQFYAVQDVSGKPIDLIGERVSVDDAQVKRFKEQQTQAATAARKETRKYPGTDPRTGLPAIVTEYESGEPSYDSSGTAATRAGDTDWHTEGTPLPDGTTDNSRPIMARTVNGRKETRQPTAKELEDWNLAGQMTRNPGGKTDAQVQADKDKAEKEKREEAERNKPQVIPSTASGTSKQIGYLKPDGTIEWVENPNYNKPNPEAVSAPSNVRSIVYRDADGKLVTEKNPNYKPPSKVDKDPDTGEMIEITEDEDGKPLIRPVRREGTATPSPAATYPALQARAGQVSQTYTAKAQQIWDRHQRGEITQKERDTALEALTAQATSQISEINSVLSNSRAIWQDQITQRGHTITDASSRRTFASNIFSQIAQVASGAGTDKKGIGRNIVALAKLGMLLGEQSGGMKDSPEIDMPAAVKESRDFTLPGFSPPNAAGFGAAPGAMAPNAAASSEVGQPGDPSLADAEAERRSAAPASPVFRPRPPVDLAPASVPPVRDDWRMGDPGSDPETPISRAGTPTTTIKPDGTIVVNHANAMSPLASMGSRLQPRPSMGTPVAAGGRGLFDARSEAASMIGDGSDPEWAAAVQEAAGSLDEDVWGPGGRRA